MTVSQAPTDRWVAATARRLGVPVVSDDGIFDNESDHFLLASVAAHADCGLPVDMGRAEARREGQRRCRSNPGS